MATGVTLGYNFRVVTTNSEAIAELKESIKEIPSEDVHDYLTLAQFNEFKIAQESDRKWMVDALYNLHLKIDEFLMGYYNTVPPPPHNHLEDTEVKPKRLNHVAN